MGRARGARRNRAGWWAACLVLLAPRAAWAAPDVYLAVGDPLESELRILDLTDPPAGPARIRLSHLHSRPLQWRELQGPGAPSESAGVARAISLTRIERALQRNALPDFAPHPRERSTPWLWRSGDSGESAELSAGVEGRGEVDRDDPRFASGSGAQARVALAFEHWLAFSHVLIGQVNDARRFADPIFPSTDIIAHTEDTYLAYTAGSGRWSARLGRSRWHWGPGEEASLALSRTSPAFTGLALRARLEPVRADLVTLSGTLDLAAGEQLAAHRLEWQPVGRLRVGLTETARYHAAGWQPLYLVGLVPYVLVQRLHQQESPDSIEAVRNNVMVSADAAWRPVTGTRLYGELLIDDLHAKSGVTPNKYAFQLGWEGVGTIGRTRVAWGGEFTRLARFVYTSSFGRAYQAQGEPIGFPTGPDARRLRLRGAWDLGADWQLLGLVTRTDKGENGLDEPFIQGSPVPDPRSFEGVVERTRAAELGVRWWPASGVDLAARVGYAWTKNDAHVADADRETATGALEVRLTR